MLYSTSILQIERNTCYNTKSLFSWNSDRLFIFTFHFSVKKRIQVDKENLQARQRVVAADALLCVALVV